LARSYKRIAFSRTFTRSSLFLIFIADERIERAFQSNTSWLIFKGNATFSESIEPDPLISSSQLPLGGLFDVFLFRYARYKLLSPGPTEDAAFVTVGDEKESCFPVNDELELLAAPPRLKLAPR
jgi:hypothetical protein